MSDTTYGADIDTFIANWIEPDDKKLATIELNLIALKAQSAQIKEMQASFPPSSK